MKKIKFVTHLLIPFHLPSYTPKSKSQHSKNVPEKIVFYGVEVRKFVVNEAE